MLKTWLKSANRIKPPSPKANLILFGFAVLFLIMELGALYGVVVVFGGITLFICGMAMTLLIDIYLQGRA